MLHRLAFLLSCAVLVAADLETVKFYNGLVHQGDWTRQIDVRTHVEEVIASGKVKNTGKEAVAFYLIAVAPEIASSLSFVQGATNDNRELKTTQVQVSGLDNAPKGTVFYKAEFATPLKADESVSIQVALAFTHRLVPYPKEIAQDESQLVQYSGNAYFFSPYGSSGKQSTVVRLGTKTVREYSKATATLKDEQLESGPFDNVKAFSSAPLTAHFENNSPFVTFRTLVREIEISHRGNIAVEEHVVLQHTGAALKGNTFSRYDYQRTNTGRGAGFRAIVASLPLGASDVYYRDQIGNISTSNLREDEAAGRQVFEVQPRFPMFGGWKTDFYFGYNLRAHEQLRVDESGRYVLNSTFGSPFPEAAIDALEVRVILPEHVTEVEFATPFDVDSAATDVRVTYLDISGRHVLVLRKRNACRFHNQYFQVGYHFSAVNMYQEPLLLIAGFAAFFLAAILYVRLELTIAKRPASKAAVRSVLRAGPVGELISRALAAHSALVSAADNGRSGKGGSERIEKAFVELEAALDALQREGDAGVAAAANRLSASAGQLRGAAKKYAKAEAKQLEAARAQYAARLEESNAHSNQLAAF